MFDPYDDQWEEDVAFDFGRLLYAFFAGHFIKPKTFAGQVARLTAIPSILIGPAALFLLIMSHPSFTLQGIACIGGLIWFCYTAWAIFMVEQAYVKDLEEAHREEL
ncbi:hypothetical protein Pan97_00950 [Bremerella volcania]|uniref:Uncharacterized protein n=2 Tax=Bremerella volcania TaxID=2527984 RepID=A0A518C1N0_9BACT|nr:hypothetical protein Pan97_00950 [Bremerella volcania]